MIQLAKSTTRQPYGTATRCKSRISGAVPYSRRGSFFMRALPAWRRSGQRGRAPAANRLICLRHRGCRPSRFMMKEAQPGFDLSTSTGRSSGNSTHERNELCPNKANKADAGECATLRVNGTGSRATPWFEGAHFLRRCAPFSKSAHLGKPRRFLRRCAPLSKVRTKTAPLRRFLFWVPRPRLCVGVSSNVKRIRTPTQSRGPGTPI
jgi:hypothetical protein